LIIRRCRFSEVDEEHVCSEGGDERTRDPYIREHTNYYKRRGVTLGFKHTTEMDVISKRFELVYP